jgi:cytochrome c oxidase subunit 2
VTATAILRTGVLPAGVPPLTEQADDIDRVWNLFLLIALGVLLLVIVLVATVVIRNRRRDNALPRQVHENIPIEIAYTVIPLLVVCGLFAITVVSVQALDDPDDEEADLVVEVTGFQWQWRFDYPDSDVSVVGSDEVVPELVLPAGRSVRFDLIAVDVIHSFWIPGFRFKRDMFPGETTSFQVDVGDRTGSFPLTGVCAEFCGLDHHKMQFSVRVLEPAEFDIWMAESAAAAGEGEDR